MVTMEEEGDKTPLGFGNEGSSSPAEKILDDWGTIGTSQAGQNLPKKESSGAKAAKFQEKCS